MNYCALSYHQIIMSSRIATSIALFAGLSSMAHAVVWANTLTNQNVLDFGDDPRFARVGVINGRGTANYFGQARDGTHWGITAKHVVDTGFTGQFYVEGTGTFTVTEVIGFAGVDISVFKIGGWTASMSTMQLYTGGSYAPGTRFVSAGYGAFGAEAAWPNQSFDGQRRGFQTRLDSFRANDPSLWFEPQPFLIDRFDAPGDPNFEPIEGFAAVGDSGSFLMDEQNRVWGFLTNGEPERYGGINWYATVTPTLANTIYQRTNVDPVPEPMTLASLGAGIAFLVRRKKKKSASS
jgi:hypothetical protein